MKKVGLLKAFGPGEALLPSAVRSPNETEYLSAPVHIPFSGVRNADYRRKIFKGIFGEGLWVGSPPPDAESSILIGVSATIGTPESEYSPGG